MNAKDQQDSITQDPVEMRCTAGVPAASLPPPPLIPEVGVIALVPDRWHWQWQQRHQVMTRLAHFFHVVWMNPAENWRRSMSFRKLLTRRVEAPVPEAGFRVYTPSPLLPEFYSPPWLAEFSLSKRLENARRLLLNRGCEKVVLYLWRPEFAPALDAVRFDCSCYHIDDEYSFSAVEVPIPEQEARLIARVDQVFIHSPTMFAKKGNINPRTSLAPNGVDFDAYARPIPEPVDLANVPHPRIGYCGHVKKQLDLPLLVNLAAAHPEWSFVLVGSVTPHPAIVADTKKLSLMSNVHFLGGKTARELAAYPQHFDVCLMPYRRDDYTKYIYPLKLHEYLASGRPTVGTLIPSLEPFRHVLGLPEKADQWAAAIREALSEAANSRTSRETRQTLARQHDWEILVRNIAKTLAQRLGPPFPDYLENRPPRERQVENTGSSQVRRPGISENE